MKKHDWKRHLTIGALGLALLGATASFAWAHGPSARGRALGMGRGLHRLLRAIDLSEAQEVALLRASRPLRDEAQRLTEAHREQGRALAAAVSENRVDGAALHAQVDQMAAERIALAHEAVDVFLSVEESLSPEQRMQLQEKLDRWLSREMP